VALKIPVNPDAMNELGELASKNSKPKDKADEGANENIEEDEVQSPWQGTRVQFAHSS